MLTKAETPVAYSDNEPGVINSSVYAGGRKVTDVAIEEAGNWSKRPGHVVWIGLFEPSDELLKRVQQQFDLHPLAIEDAGKAHQHPKLEQYGDGIFIVARTAQMVEGRIAFGETHLFVGRGYVISVRHGASVSYAAVRHRCEACPTVLSQGEDYIVYAILDFIVDNYMPVVEKIQAEVEAIEDTVLATTLSHPDIERLYMLRYGRDPAGDGEDALNNDQRLLRQERKDPRGRPDGARDVLVRGQEACLSPRSRRTRHSSRCRNPNAH